MPHPPLAVCACAQVESVMLFSAVIVCLMGILYDSGRVSTAYASSRDAVTGVVIATIAITIVYFVTVVVTEIVILYNESATRRAIASGKMASAEKAARKSQRNLIGKDGKGGGAASGASGAEGEINVGRVDATMNPMFMSGGGGGGMRLSPHGMNRTCNCAAQKTDGNADAASSRGTQQAILGMREPPSADTWPVVRDTFAQLFEQLEATQAALAEAKLVASRVTAGGDVEEGGGGASARVLTDRGKRQLAGGGRGSQRSRQPARRDRVARGWCRRCSGPEAVHVIPQPAGRRSGRWGWGDAVQVGPQRIRIPPPW